MGLDSHIEQLRTKHADLDELIRLEQKRPASDATRLRILKTEKLHLKEELDRLAEPN